MAGAYRGIVPDEFLRALSIEERHVGWQRMLETGEPLTWVAEDGDIALGWISAGRSRDVKRAPVYGRDLGYICGSGSLEQRSRTRACAAAGQELRRQGFTDVILWVLKDNERALQFYVLNGFIRDACEDRIIERGGKALSVVRMKKQYV